MRSLNVSIVRLLTVIGLTIPASLSAATIYTAILAGTNEVPGNASMATGSIMVTLNGNLLSVNETFSGLSTALSTAAHIHCCGPIGTNVAVAVPFVGFPAATSGTYMQTFDLTMAATYNPTFLTSVGGTAAQAQTAVIAGLNGGNTYANIHDATFPGGEIRGQLQAIPEPASVALLLLGLAPIVRAARRRR